MPYWICITDIVRRAILLCGKVQPIRISENDPFPPQYYSTSHFTELYFERILYLILIFSLFTFDAWIV